MRLLVGFLAVGFTVWGGDARAQSLSQLVPNLVFAEVTLTPGPATTPPVPGTPHTAHFSPFNPLFGIDAATQAVLDSQLRQVPELMRQANAQLATFPIGSSSGGFTYRFDPALGAFSRSSESFGGFLSERALTLGRGQFSYGTVFQHTSYDRYENVSLRNGDIVFYYPHNDCCPGQSAVGVPDGDDTLLNPAFEGDVLENALTLDLRTETFAFFATAGVTDRLDIGVAVPFVRVALDAEVTRTIRRFATATNPLVHSFDNAGLTATATSASGTAAGVGDVLVRAKYQLFSGARGALALGGELRLPTGDELELLGTGSTQGKGAVLGTVTFRTLSLHANVAFAGGGAVSDDAAESFVAEPSNELDYAFGLDAPIHPRVTAAVEISGRRLMSVSRLISQPLTVRFTTLDQPGVVQSDTLPGLGIEEGSMDLVLGVVGMKVNVARTLLLNAGVLFRMSNDGLHNRTTASFGVDYTFGR